MKGTSFQVDALVIGATGFIGNHLMHTLIQAGKTVRVLVRKGKKSEMLSDLPVEVAYGSLENKDSVVKAASGVATIYNCAGLSSDWAATQDFFDANIVGVENVLIALEKSGANRLVHISTSDVYGYPKKPCDETREIKDVGLPYNRSKVEGEQIIWKAVKERNLPVTVFRPASVYGPRSMEWVVEISQLMLKKDMVLLSGGTSPAGLVYVENLTKLMMIAAEASVANGKSYNIRDTGIESWKDFIDGMGECFVDNSWSCSKIPASLAYGFSYCMELLYGVCRIKSRPLLTRHAVHLLSKDQSFDISRAQQDLGFKSWISFEEGMELTRKWMCSEEGKRCILGTDKLDSTVYVK